MKPKAIHDEMGATFDDYGRMSAKLGLEVPFTNAAIANFILQNFVDPATEIVRPNEIQIWRITHNGVDAHPIHFHLFDVQVLNRVGWDGFIRLPDDNELGWKDTVRITRWRTRSSPCGRLLPGALRAAQQHPSAEPGDAPGLRRWDSRKSTRQLAAPLVPPQTNQMVNFGHEYVWHCHILSHEENDMMRPIIFNTNAKTEILWRNTSTGGNVVWNMDGVTRTGTPCIPPGQSGLANCGQR